MARDFRQPTADYLRPAQDAGSVPGANRCCVGVSSAGATPGGLARIDVNVTCARKWVLKDDVMIELCRRMPAAMPAACRRSAVSEPRSGAGRTCSD